MLQRAGVIKQPQEQGTNQGAITFLMPPEARNHAVAIALVLDLEHHAFVGLVGSVSRFRDYAVEARPFEAAKPIICDIPIAGGRSQVNGRWTIRKQ